MELHRLLADVAARVAHHHLGGRQRAAALASGRLRGAHCGKVAHRARLLDMDEHVRHAMLQRLEPGDGNAELLACLRVLDGRVEGGLQRAHRFRAADCEPLIERGRECGEGGPVRADERAGRVRQLHVGGAHAVERTVLRERHAGTFARHREDRDAGGLVGSARRPRRDQHQIGGRRVQHHRLAPLQYPAAATAPCAGGDAVQIVAGSRLEVRRNGDPVAGGHGDEHLLALLRRAQLADEDGADDGRGDPGLEQHGRSRRGCGEQRLHHRRRHPALLLGDLQREQAELRQLRPGLPAPSFARVEDLPPRIEPVLLGEKPLDHVAELLLLGSRTEPHESSYSPRIVWAMMFFWISFEPP